jgi:hypothetical protein
MTMLFSYILLYYHEYIHEIPFFINDNTRLAKSEYLSYAIKPGYIRKYIFTHFNNAQI